MTFNQINVGYTPTEWFQNLQGKFVCAHAKTHSEEMLRSMSGSYDNPREDMILVSVCDSCGKAVDND